MVTDPEMNMQPDYAINPILRKQQDELGIQRAKLLTWYPLNTATVGWCGLDSVISRF